MVTLKEIENLAALARISLTREEKEKMRSEFDAILAYVASIREVSATVAKNARSITATLNVMREDADPHESGVYTEALLSVAPKREGDYIKVKKIL